MSSIILYDDKLLRSVVREQLAYRPSTATLNEAMLYEGISRGMVKDAIQFVVGAGAEYGLGAVTLPAAGAGLAIGPTVETMVDGAFAAEEVAGTISAVSSIGSKLGEYGELWGEARSAYGGDLSAYYQTLVKIVRQALNDLGKKAEGKVEDLAEKLQGAIEKLISRLVGALKAGIKLIIPDAAIGLAAAKAFEEGLEALSENAFDLLASAVSKVKMLKDFVSDPSIAVDFFKDVFAQVVELMLTGAKKLEDMSWVKAMMAAGPAGGAALKKLGPAGLEKAASLIKDKAPSIIKIIDNVLTVLIPTAITAVGLFQILMTGDWKKEGDDAEEKQPASNEKKEKAQEQLAASYNLRGNNMLITKGRLRKLIRESVVQRSLLKEEMISIVRNDYEDVEDINILANYALRDDMQGALNDESLQYYIDKNEMGYLVDDSWGWLKHVGDEERYNMPAPEGWDLNKVTQFFKDFENEAYSVYSQKSKIASDNAPNLPERTALGSAFTMGPLLPEDIQHITYQTRRKGGKINWIMLEDDGGELGHMSTGIDASDAKQYQTDLDKIIKVLDDGGATGRKKRKPVKHTPPMYD